MDTHRKESSVAVEVEKPATGKPTSDDSQLNQRSQKHEERCYRISTEVQNQAKQDMQSTLLEGETTRKGPGVWVPLSPLVISLVLVAPCA